MLDEYWKSQIDYVPVFVVTFTAFLNLNRRPLSWWILILLNLSLEWFTKLENMKIYTNWFEDL